MHLNDAGEMVVRAWNDMPRHYGNVELDESVIMPNHFHGIIVLPLIDAAMPNVGAGPCACPEKYARNTTKGQPGLPLHDYRCRILFTVSNHLLRRNTALRSGTIIGRHSTVNYGSAIITNMLSAMTLN